MTRFLLYAAVFAVVLVILTQESEGKKAALKKRSLKSEKIDMSLVRDKIKNSVDQRKKRAASTPVDKIRQKRRARQAAQLDIAKTVQEVVPSIQNYEKKMSSTRRKRDATNTLRSRMIKNLKQVNTGNRKKRAVESKAPSFARSQVAKLSKVGKNIKKFHQRK